MRRILTNGWDCSDDFAKFELIKNRGFSCCVETHHQNSHLPSSPKFVKQLRECETHDFEGWVSSPRCGGDAGYSNRERDENLCGATTTSRKHHSLQGDCKSSLLELQARILSNDMACACAISAHAP